MLNRQESKSGPSQKAIPSIHLPTPRSGPAFEVEPDVVDTVDTKTRIRIMSRVSGKNTRPEMVVRRLVYSLGYRYRLHPGSLPGKPDLAFIGRRKVIFVHGCFWHRHESCPLARLPKSRQDFWIPKLDGTRVRDERHYAALAELGWEVLVVWECELRDTERLKDKIISFLES